MVEKGIPKTEKNDGLVNLKMKLTFPSRRTEIVKEDMTISDILRKYPFLKDMREVRLSFQFLHDDLNFSLFF